MFQRLNLNTLYFSLLSPVYVQHGVLQIRRGTKRSAKPAAPVLLLLQPARHVCRHVPSGAGKLCDVMFRALLVGFHDV